MIIQKSKCCHTFVDSLEAIAPASDSSPSNSDVFKDDVKQDR